MRDSAENLRFDIGSEMVKNLISSALVLTQRSIVLPFQLFPQLVIVKRGKMMAFRAHK